jgi:hypothetical protein
MWLNVDGSEMATETWTQGWVKSLGVILFGDSIDVDEHGEEISGDTLLVLFNAAPGHVIPFTLPGLDEPQPWSRCWIRPRHSFMIPVFPPVVHTTCNPSPSPYSAIAHRPMNESGDAGGAFPQFMELSDLAAIDVQDRRSVGRHASMFSGASRED